MNGDSHLWLVTALYHMCTVTYIKQYKKVPTHLPITQFKNWFRYIRLNVSPIFVCVCLNDVERNVIFKSFLPKAIHTYQRLCFYQFAWNGNALLGLPFLKLETYFAVHCKILRIESTKLLKWPIFCFIYLNQLLTVVLWLVNCGLWPINFHTVKNSYQIHVSPIYILCASNPFDKVFMLVSIIEHLFEFSWCSCLNL